MRGGRLRRVSDRKESGPDLPTFVFVVTYGRSGSTLVQGLLNALPSTTVRGENGLYALDLYETHRRAATFATDHAKHRPRRVQSAFYGAHLVTDDRLARLERNLVLGLLLEGRRSKWPKRVGFKEVLWHRIPAEETEGFFAWFDLVFPDARYVLNTREMEDASRSGFWRSVDREEAIGRMQRVVEIQDFLRSTRPDRVHDTRYEILTGDDAAASDRALSDLARFVTGKVDTGVLEKMRQVLEVGHGPHPFRGQGHGGSAEQETQQEGVQTDG